MVAALSLAVAGCSDRGDAIVIQTAPATEVPPVPTAEPTSSPAPGRTASPSPTPPTATSVPTVCTDARYPPIADPPPLPPWSPPALTEDAGLVEVIEELLGADQEHVSVVALDVTGGRSARINGAQVRYAASLYKLPLLFEATWQIDSGVLDSDEAVALLCAYVEQDLGTLEPLGIEVGDEVRIADAVRYMTIASDNALAHLLNDLLGPLVVDAHLHALGATSTSVSTPTLPTTADDIARILQAVALGYPSEAAGEAMFGLLSEQWIRTRLPLGVPAEAVVGNKTGDYPGAAHDAAVIRAPFGTYVLVMLTDGQVDDALFERVSAAVYAYLGQARP